MRIVFDSYDQKEQIIRSFCIDELFVERETVCDQNCEECWERHVDMEVGDE